MLKTARLTIAYAHSEFARNADMAIVLKKAMKKAKISWDDIAINVGSNKTHYGNWCLVPILDNDAAEKLAKVMGTKLDYRQTYLEESDIPTFKAGDKVKIAFLNDFCMPVHSEGKVCRAIPTCIKKGFENRGEIAIFKGRSRSKGWVFHPGDQVLIERI